MEQENNKSKKDALKEGFVDWLLIGFVLLILPFSAIIYSISNIGGTCVGCCGLMIFGIIGINRQRFLMNGRVVITGELAILIHACIVFIGGAIMIHEIYVRLLSA